jgi:hypothetical protein
MFAHINEVSVLVTAILAIAVGSIWYSPLLFGNIWMEAAGLKSTDLEMSGRTVVRSLMSAFIANLIFILAIAQFVDIAKASGASVWNIGFLLLLLLVASLSSAVIWEKRSFMYLVIHGGYSAFVIFGGIAVIAYWPW